MNIKKYPKIDKNIREKLSDYSDIVATLLANRGITTKKHADNFLNTTIEDLYSPFDLQDIQKAIDRVLLAKENNEKVFIYGDYDVDGVTATSLLWDFLYRKMKIHALPYIPSRFEEGYGLSESGIERIIDEGGSLIITVDCGIRDIELIKKYSDRVDFIITDHHTVAEDKEGKKLISKDAIATVHPKHPNSKYPFKEICGAAVSWKLVNAVFDYCKQEEIVQFGKFHPNQYIDLVALATVTDIMPLVDENRIILKEGIEQMRNTKNLGLRTLMLKTDIDPQTLDTYHFGFVIGPRINAAGRIESALDAVRLLSTTKLKEASKFSDKLNNLNTHRQDITKKILEEAKEKIYKEHDIDNDNLIFVWGEEWPEGVVGLVAGKLQEEFYRPVLVASIKDGVATGSARSIAEFDVTEAISESEEILKRFGGHVQAAGFTILEKNLEKFKENMLNKANEDIKDKDLIKKIKVDLELSIDDINKKILEEISLLHPFGMGNPRPTFLIPNVEIHKKFLIGRDKNHVKLIFKNKNNENIEMLGFNKVKDFEDVDEGDKIDIVGSLDKNIWNGRETLQIKLKDFSKK